MALSHASFQEALTPFDLQGWLHSDKEDERELLKRYFQPLASARKAPLEEAVDSFLLVRPLAQEIRKRGEVDPDKYWLLAGAERDMEQSHKALLQLVAPMVTQWIGNGEIESDFSRLGNIALTSRGFNKKMLRAVAKAPVSDFTTMFESANDGPSTGHDNNEIPDQTNILTLL